jgi:hypothetical protein
LPPDYFFKHVDNHNIATVRICGRFIFLAAGLTLVMFIFFKTSLQKSWEKYVNETGHRFYEFSHLVLIILVYVILAFFAFDSNLNTYAQDDIWFWFFHQYFPAARWVVLGVFVYFFGQYLWLDWSGKMDKQEEAKAKQEQKKNKKPKRKQKFREKLNIYYWLMMIAEGFVYGALIFIGLRYVVFFFLDALLGEVFLSQPLDTNPALRYYQSSPLQDFAFSFGSGFFEEIIFRFALLLGLIWLGKNVKYFSLFKNPQTTTVKLAYKEYKIPKFKAKDSGSLYLIVASALIYSLSHHILPFSDFFGTYPIMYRFFFGVIMYLIFVWRKLSIVIWTHVMYNLLYFVTA